MNKFLDQYLPLVAILRGVTPDEIVSVATVLVDAGFEMLEVPFNSPEPVESIKHLAKHFGDSCLVGAGTVLTKEHVDAVKSVGGQLIVSPNTDPSVISHASANGMVSLPGVATPTEAFAALNSGAHGLKLFPVSALHASFFKALNSVLPSDTFTFAVGGVNAKNMSTYLDQGIGGVGFGSSLYKPGKSIAELKIIAEDIISRF